MIRKGTVVCIKAIQDLPNDLVLGGTFDYTYKRLSSLGPSAIRDIENCCYYLEDGKPCPGCEDCPGKIDLGDGCDCYGQCYDFGNKSQVFMFKEVPAMVILENGNIES